MPSDVSFFNSCPGTPKNGFSASSCPSTPNGSRSGALIYAEFMDNYHRRLRKPQPHYGDDAAGLTNSHRYNGKGTSRYMPTKGKGTPPPDNFEPVFRPTKKYIQGRSFEHSGADILQHPDNKPRTNMMTMSMDSGMLSLALQQERPMSATGTRPCLRMCPDQSFRSSLQGSGLTCIAEQPLKRPIRKPGTAAPTGDTKARVLVLAEDVSTAPPPSRPRTAAPPSLTIDDNVLATNTPRDAMLNQTWARHAYEAGVASAPAARPSTAPSTPTGCNMSEARQRYHRVNAANLDVFNYRHSGGICNKEYKLDDSRLPAPQLTSPEVDASRTSYYEARMSYAKNRVTALTSLRQYA